MDNHDILILSKNLRNLKLKHKLTQKQLAEISGISVASIRKLLNNQLPTGFGVNVIYNLAKYFKVSICELFTLDLV